MPLMLLRDFHVMPYAFVDAFADFDALCRFRHRASLLHALFFAFAAFALMLH